MRVAPPQRRPAEARRAERSAATAARRVVRGEIGVRQLGRAPVAARPEGNSLGAPLPGDLLQRLERGFDADLSQVRLHTDTAAVDAVERESARAFAAGRDVYVGRDVRADLRSDRGFTTLAHEVAHVLQQTGREGADGRLVTRAAAGSAGADIQREDLVENVDKYQGNFHEPPGYDEIRKAYGKVPGADKEIAEVNKIYPLDTFGWSSTADHDKLVARTTTKEFAALSDDVKAFYVDCLKAVKRYAQAAAIFKTLPSTTQTAYRSKELYLELRKDLAWLPALAKTHPFVKQYYPSGVLDAFHHYFYGPVQVIVAPGDDYWDKSFAERKRFAAQESGRKDSELSMMTVQAMEQLADDQRQSLEAFGEATTADRPDEEKLRIAEAYATRTADDPTIGAPKATKPEVRALYDDLWPEVKKRAEAARTFWKRIKTFHDALIAGFGFETLSVDEAKALAKEVGGKPQFGGLDDVLIKVANALVNVEPVPEPAAYRARVDQQREALRKHAARYGALLIELARKPKKTPADERLMLQYGLVLRDLLDTRRRIESNYDHAADLALTKDGHDDERLAARIRIGGNVSWSARTFGLSRVTAAVDQFFTKDKPRLALLSDWEVDPKAMDPLEFRGQIVSSFEESNVDWALISRFFFADYLNALADAIDIALDPAKNPTAVPLGQRTSILADAIKTVKVVDRPQRYLLKKREFWYDPAGAVTLENNKPVPDRSKSFSALLFAHWRTQKLTNALPLEAKAYVLGRPPKQHEPLVLWTVPRFDRLARRLMQITELDRQVQDYISRTSKGITIYIEGYEWMPWMWALEGLADELRKKQKLEEVTKPLGEELESDYDKARHRFYRAARKATVLQVQPHLERYRDSERDNADAPERVFALITQFSLATQIESDQPSQATLLALELADDLSRTFGPKDLRWVFAVVGVLFKYTTGAVAVWNDPKWQPEVKKGRQPGTTEAQLEKAAITLTKMRDTLGAAVRGVQESRGLTGRTTTGGANPNTNGEIKTIELIPSIEAGKSFFMYLREWELVKVHVDFDYLPAFPEIESLGVTWPHSEVARAGAMLVVDATPGPTKGTRLPPDTQLLTFRRRTHKPQPSKRSKQPRIPPGPWEDVVITAADLPTLRRLYLDFGDWSGLQYIKAAGEGIEAIVLFELELAEFIPGIGQGISVARFIAAIIAFLDSDEFEELMDAFKEDGFKAIPKLVEKVAGLLKPSAAKLFAWFFFGKPTMIEPPAHSTAKIEEQQKKATSGGVWAKLARVIRNIAHFAKKLLGTVERLRNKAQAPFRAAQSFVLSHPALAMVVGFIVRYFDLLASLVMDTLFADKDEKNDVDFVTQLKNAVTGGIKGLAERVSHAVNAVRDFQLPQEIVPLDLVGEFVVDRVISSLGGKYKAIAKGSRFALQKIPGNPWGIIMKKIGESLVDVSGVDPNDLYRSAARTHVQDAIDGVRTDVFSWLEGVFKEPGLLKELGIKVDFSPGAKTAIDFAGIDFHDGSEAEQSPAVASHAPVSMGSLYAPSGGDRLSRPLRARAEASFGHDLAHVRLHQGAEGETVTGRMHADAVTSGSHIYLHPTVSPRGGGHGEHVLRHELGHVLQQTGARPLGGSYDDAPSAGRPGRGLTVDPAREAAAERVAERTASAAHAARPADVGAPAEGPQPSLDRGFVKEMLERLRDPSRLKEEALDVSQVTVMKAENLLREDALNRTVAEKLPAKLIAAIKAMKPADFQAPFDSIAEKLKTITGSSDNQAHFEKAIKVLVVSVRETRSPKRTKDQPAPEVAFWLNPARFARELARYLYARTGLAFELSFAIKDGPETIGKAEIIDLDATVVRSTAPKTAAPAMRVAPFAALKVGHVHLPFLGDTKEAHELWELLATNSFSSESGFTADKELWIAATRLAVGHLLPKPGMYLQSKFELSTLAKRSTRSQFTRIQPLKQHWPAPGDYGKTKSPAGPTTDPIAAHTGLRVGTFGDLEKERVDEKVDDRDPHHVPQVLLIDYFSNTHNKLHPFPELLTTLPPPSGLYPGVTASTFGAVKEIGPIDIDTYTKGTRSDALPAILIAVHTHQAEVHVGTEPPDEKSKRATMGGWVQTRFRGKMGDGLWKVMNNRTALVQLQSGDAAKEKMTAAGVSTSRKELGDTIVAAAKGTYSEMYVEMMGKLRRGLHEQEIEYYNLIATSKKGSPLSDGEKLKPTHVLAAYTTFETTIKTIMKTARFE